ncbi:MAG: 2OG-Fe(II) oxygenase [Lysobacterales bacterium]
MHDEQYPAIRRVETRGIAVDLLLDLTMPKKLAIGERTDIFMVKEFLSRKECEEMIAKSESHGFEEAAISTAFGQVVVKNIRNNDRILWDDPLLADDWWHRCREFVPPSFGKWHAYGVNERFGFYRYKPGQVFRKHQDGSFRRGKGDESWWTLMVYLNAGFVGGRTRFWFVGSENETVVEPEVGMALFFLHERTHEEELVEEGTKYVLRTDVMYRQV